MAEREMPLPGTQQAHGPDEPASFARREIKGMFDGAVLPLLVRLAVPILAGMVFQLLYNITDTIWISRIDLADPSYVGGTGIIFPLMFLAIALSNGITVGTSSLVARAIGERNAEVLGRIAESGLALSLALGAAVIVPGYLFAPRLLRILGAEGDYLLHGLQYLYGIAPAAVLMFVSAVFIGILQGEGMMKHVMRAMITGTVANIILDPIFIFPLGMGVVGAALATDIAQALAVGYMLSVFLRRKTLVAVQWKLRQVQGATIRKIAAVGFPQSVAQILMSFSFLIFNRVVVSLDPLALTAFALCGRMDQAVLMPSFAVAAALVTMVGQNAGRRNFDRIREIWSRALLAAGVVVAAVAAAMVLLAPLIYPFFSNIDGVVRYAVLQTRIMEFSFLFAVVGILGAALFQAIGHPLPAVMLTLLRLVIIGVPATLLFVYVLDLGMYGVWLGLIAGNSLSAAVTMFWALRSVRLLKEGRLRVSRA
jgi:putative MATE family efflux protein